MRQLLNHCLVFFRREQVVPKPVVLTPEQYRAAVAEVAKQLKQLL